MSNGYTWRRQRQFSLAHLKHFGEGKRTLEYHIQLECSFLCETFQQEMGKWRTSVVLSHHFFILISEMTYEVMMVAYDVKHCNFYGSTNSNYRSLYVWCNSDMFM